MQQSSSNLQQQRQQQPQLASALEQKLSRIIIISNVLMQFVHTHTYTNTHEHIRPVTVCVLMAPQAMKERERERLERGRAREKVHGIIKYSFMAYEDRISVSREGREGKGRLGQVQ